MEIRTNPSEIKTSSIDKNGKVDGDDGYNAAEGELTSPTGFGWFQVMPLTSLRAKD